MVVVSCSVDGKMKLTVRIMTTHRGALHLPSFSSSFLITVQNKNDESLGAHLHYFQRVSLFRPLLYYYVSGCVTKEL